MGKTKSYSLVKDGKNYDDCYASSLSKARKIFNHKWSGNYTIICNSNDLERKNVRLA